MNIKIDYSIKADKKALQKKWEILQIIWEIYKVSGEGDNIIVPSFMLLGLKMPKPIVDMVLDGFQIKKYFTKWSCSKDKYYINGINHRFFKEEFLLIKLEYKKYAENEQRRHPQLFIVPKIYIQIDINKKNITRDKNGKKLEYPFRIVGGKNKRFDYVMAIVRNSGILAKMLNPDVTPQHISKEKNKINKNLNEKLELEKDFIINEGVGYRIDNKFYEVGFV